MSTPGQLVPDYFDPARVVAEVFSDATLAADLAFALACHEVNALVGFLESYGRHAPTALWLTHHLADGDDPPRHQN